MSVLAVDIGSAFVDLVLARDGKAMATKVPVGGRSAVEALLSSIDEGCHLWDQAVRDLAELRVASTEAVNMLLSGRGPRVGLITNAGFGDVLALGRQNRAALYDPVARSPSPTFLVEPDCVAQIRGRLDSQGREMEPLSVQEIRDAAARLAGRGVESIAVCLLFSHVDPLHEKACAEILRGALAGIPITLSHEVDGKAREFERTVSTCLEAWLRPSQIDAIERIEAGLSERGFAGRLSFADSRGHLLEPTAARRHVATLVAGGPAAAGLRGAEIVRHLDAEQALVADIGSVSTDLVLVENGRPVTTSRAVYAGVPLRLPMTDVESIAMGGSRAVEVDAAGSCLGSHPARDSATLDDALAFLKHVPAAAAPHAAGRMRDLAGVLGVSAEEAARLAVETTLDRLASAILSYATRRNVDPARLMLVAQGGLGPALAASLADRLGIRRVAACAIPAVAGAQGLLSARHVTERWRNVGRPLPELTDGDLAQILAELGFDGPGGVSARLVMDIAPEQSMHPVSIELDGSQTVAALREAYEAYHARRYAAPPAGPGFVFSFGVLSIEEPTDERRGGARGAPAFTTADANIPSPLSEGGFVLPEGWGNDETSDGVFSFSRRAVAGGLRPGTLQMRLDAIAQGMQETLFGTAISPAVREGNDAAAALLTLEGEIIALSDAIPLLLGALDGSVRSILAEFPIETIRDGELYFMNDPYAGGTHLPDITVMRPVFAQGRPVCLAATILHHQDVGGMRGGSVPPDATDIHQEGLRLPPMKMGSAGVIDPPIARLVTANSRSPAVLLGDLAAQISAANQAVRAIERLVAETGLAGFFDGVTRCLDLGEVQARAAVRAMPAGPHQAVERLDPMPGLPDVSVRLSLNCEDGRFRADFTGTSVQVPAPINCVRSGPYAAALFSLLSLMGKTPFRNGGVARVIELVLPEGCAINASPPAAVNARMGIVRATTSAFLQAIGRARPDIMPAPNSGMSFVLAFSGRRLDGSPFVSTEIIAGGAGGGPNGHGASGISTDVGNAMNMPAESLEASAPLRLVKSEVRRGSGGEGRYRGGDGIRRVYLALCDGIAVSLRGERFVRVPDGLIGGGSPEPSAAYVKRADGTVESLASRSTPTLNKGDHLIVESCGGAGYGSVDG